MVIIDETNTDVIRKRVYCARLKGFTGHRTVEQQAARQAKVEAQISQANTDVKALEVLEAYKPNSASAEFFETIGRSKDGYYTLQEVRAFLAQYIKDKQLSDPKNQRFIRLDEVLHSALTKKGEQIDKVPRDHTSDRYSILKCIALYHLVAV